MGLPEENTELTFKGTFELTEGAKGRGAPGEELHAYQQIAITALGSGKGGVSSSPGDWGERKEDW